MTTPNRPPFPDWYQADRGVPPHVGPSQRELLSRRIRSLRRFLIGASFIGVATFTTLAAYHTESNASASTAQAAVPTVAQQSTSSTAATTPTQSLFSDRETHGFTAETHESEGESENSAVAAAATQPATSSQSTSSSQTTTSQSTSAQTTSRFRTRTVSS